MQTTIEILKAARELIADPNRWCQDVYARDATGKDVVPDDPAACQWCALGAIERFSEPPSYALEAIAALIPDRSLPAARMQVPDVNDTDGHAAVLEMFDAAILRHYGY